MRSTRRDDSRSSTPVGPAMAALIAVGLAAGFASILVAAVGFEGFVAAGNVYSTGASIHVHDHIGYDGQFFYRLALEPFSTAAEVDGVTFDAPAYRQQRIGYPLLVHAVTVLTPLVTVQSLVVVNVVATGALVFFMARIAHASGRSPMLGLLVLAWPAFTFSLGLDLAEIVAAAFVAAATDQALRGRHIGAASLLVVAVLTRETALLAALAALVVSRRVVYTAVLTVFAAWQLTIWAMWSEIPGITSLPAPGERVTGLPLVGFFQALSRWDVLDLAVFVALLAVGYVGVRHIRRSPFPAVMLGGYGIMLACLGWPVWESWRGFSRAAVEFVLMAFVLRFGPGSRTSGSASTVLSTPHEAGGR